MARQRDYYELLGVGRQATADEIQRAYRKLARTYHPDVNKDPSAEEMFKDISEAYDVLSDPDLRRRYDAFGHDFRRVPPDVDPSSWAAAGAGAGSGRRQANAAWRHQKSGRSDGWSGVGFDTAFDDQDIEDLMRDLLGSGGRRQRASVGGADQQAELPITIDEAYHGGRQSIALPGVDGPRQITVDIPAGVVDGQQIRLAGQGGRGSDGGQPGDLYLVVRITPDSRYRLEGRDILVGLAVSPWEATLGTSVQMDTPGGSVQVRVPAGSSCGRKLRLRHRGMPGRRRAAGDLIVELGIKVPRTLSDEERRLFEELAKVSTFDPRKRR